jgi:hypothetical protein
MWTGSRRIYYNLIFRVASGSRGKPLDVKDLFHQIDYDPGAFFPSHSV